MIFLIQLEHVQGFLVTYLVRAKHLIDAKHKLDKWLFVAFPKKNGEWYISSDREGVRIQTIAEIHSLDDLTNLIPLIK